MKIVCLSCGHKIDVGDAYDDYAGPVKCATCGARLDIKTEAGQLKTVAEKQDDSSGERVTPMPGATAGS